MVKVTIQDIGNTEATEDNQVKEETESENEIQPPPTKAKPQQKLITCPNCNKEMLQKTFKYYHSIKCKPAQVEQPQVQPKPERIEVSFGVGRQITTSEKLQKLMSNAF